MSEVPPPPDLFPCGCFINYVITEEGQKEMRISACKESCEVLQIAIEVGERHGKRIERRHG